jgi:hypothetical protein
MRGAAVCTANQYEEVVPTLPRPLWDPPKRKKPKSQVAKSGRVHMSHITLHDGSSGERVTWRTAVLLPISCVITMMKLINLRRYYFL